MGAGFGCNTYSFVRTLPAAACARRLAKLGFTEFEFMIHPDHLWPGQPGEVAAVRAALGGTGKTLTVNMPNIDINVAAEAEPMRLYSIALLEQVVDLAGELGAAGVVVGPGKANPLFPAPAETLRGHFFRALDRLVPRAKARGTAIWVENMPFAFLPGIDGLMNALSHYGADEVGIVYDVANAYFIGEDFGHGLGTAGSRLRLVHLSDTGRKVYRHDPVGQGTVPFATVPSLLASVGYTRHCMLEIISETPDADISDSVARLKAMEF